MYNCRNERKQVFPKISPVVYLFFYYTEWKLLFIILCKYYLRCYVFENCPGNPLGLVDEQSWFIGWLVESTEYLISGQSRFVFVWMFGISLTHIEMEIDTNTALPLRYLDTDLYCWHSGSPDAAVSGSYQVAATLLPDMGVYPD